MSKTYFDKVYNYVRQPQYYVSQSHTTIGGFWAFDLYKRDGIIVKLLDEGSSRQIITSDLNVVQDYHDELVFYEGGFEVLEKLHQEIINKI